MKVAAKCTMPVWESNACVMLTPGGGSLPGGLYEIENNGILARMKFGNSYVFDFDRNMTKTDDGVVVVKDYSCKKCGKKFNALAELGKHSNQMHRGDEIFLDGTEDEPVEPRVDKRKLNKGRTYTCHDCGKVNENLYRHRIHLAEHKNAPVEQAETVEL